MRKLTLGFNPIYCCRLNTIKSMRGRLNCRDTKEYFFSTKYFYEKITVL